MAALLASDVDAFVRMSERGAARLKADGRFALLQSGSRAKTIVAFNHRHAALRDVRVRHTLCTAIDRQGNGGLSGVELPPGPVLRPDNANNRSRPGGPGIIPGPDSRRGAKTGVKKQG